MQGYSCITQTLTSKNLFVTGRLTLIAGLAIPKAQGTSLLVRLVETEHLRHDDLRIPLAEGSLRFVANDFGQAWACLDTGGFG